MHVELPKDLGRIEKMLVLEDPGEKVSKPVPMRVPYPRQ